MIVTRKDRLVLKKLLKSCFNDPARFARKVLGWTRADINALTAYQEELCGLVAHYKTVVVPAGHSVGKSRCAALLIVWWLLTRGPGSMVMVTAPSQHLIGSVIYKELRKLLRTSRIPLGGSISRSMKASPQVYELGDGWAAIGFATIGAERAQGQHSPHLLVLVDEASGVQAEIFESIHSWNPEKLVLLGNPLKASGDFVSLFKRSKSLEEQELPPDERAVSLVISSLDSPHIHIKKSPCGLADQNFLQEIIRDYGVDSLYWRLHIDVNKDNPFPTEDHEQLIATEWIDRCISVVRRSGGRRGLAMDVARGSGKDRTVIVIGDVYGLHHVWQSNTTSLQDAARLVKRFADQFGVPPHMCVYDAGGWAGSDAERYLQSVGFGNARKYFGNDSGGPRFVNKRSWCAWQLRRRLDPNLPAARGYTPADPTMPLYGPADFVNPRPEPQPGFHISMGNYWQELREEIISLRYSYSGKKMALEKKEDLTLRLGKSPDLCDSMLMLTSVLWGELEAAA